MFGISIIKKTTSYKNIITMSLFSTTKRSYVYTGSGDDVPVHTTHLTVHESVKSIPKDAFRHCRELKEVYLPEGLKSIGENAFKGCSWMEKINLPASLTSIYQDYRDAFYECDIVEISSATSIYPSRMPRKRTTLTSSTKAIQPYAFRNDHSLIEVVIPESVETIGQSAFRGCAKLRCLRIPPSVTKLERNTFNGCNSLLSLELPEELSNIEKFTLSGQESLRNIALPVNCTVGESNWFAKLPSDTKETDSVLKSASEIAKLQADEISAVKHRFDGLPIHKLCYYQPECLLQYLNQPINSLKEKRALTTGMLQDNLGMTPLHILACSTRQNIELYQLLLELYPENLITKDKWGELPLLYAFWSNASKEIVQLLIKSHKELFPTHKIDWRGMVTTLGKNNVSYICIHDVLDMYNSLCLNNVDWEALVIELAQPGSKCGKFTMRFIVRSVITKRLSLVGIGNCREGMIKDVDSWQYQQDRVGRYKKLFSKLKTYEYQNEVATLLELALWKFKMDQSATTNQSKTDEGSKKKARTGEDRLESHASCGADIILPHVVAFLFRKEKLESVSASDGEAEACAVTSPTV